MPPDHMDGTSLLTKIANAVLDLDAIPNPGTFTLPYPPSAQRALDRTVLCCLLRGADPPRSVPELLVWCRERPVVDWPISLPADLVGPDDRLIGGTAFEPTQLCHEWAIDPPDVASMQVERTFTHSALERCRLADSPRSFSEFRRLLIERPVLTKDKAVEIGLSPAMAPVDGLLKRIYLPAPTGYARHRRFSSCGRCKTLLLPVAGSDWWCDNDPCRDQGPARVGAEYGVDDGGGVLQLIRPLRLFVTRPGQAEIELERQLADLGCGVEMWPGYGAYDLRVSLPGGQVWAVDAKDWASPALMGRNATLLPPEPVHDAAYIVVPDHRAKRRRDYLAIARKNLRPAVRASVEVRRQGQFVAEVRTALAGGAAEGVDSGA